MSIKNYFTSLLKFFLASFLIYWMIHEGILDLKILYYLVLDIEYLFIIIILVFLTIFINNTRWTSLLRTRGFEVSWQYTLSLSFIGVFFNFAIPGGVGGDVVKAYYLIKDNPEKRMIAGMTVLMDRIIGMYSMFLLAMMAMLIDIRTLIKKEELITIALVVFLFFILITSLFIFSFSIKAQNSEKLKRLWKKLPGGNLIKKIFFAVHEYKDDKKIIFKAILLSFLSQICVIFLFVAVGYVLNERDISLINYIMVVPLGLICTVIPIAPAGIGVGQAAFYFLFKIYAGVDSSVGPIAATSHQIFLFLWGLVGAYFYLTRQKVKFWE